MRSVQGILVALVVGLPMTVSAQTETLDYMGSPFTSVNTDGNPATALANTPPENTGEVILSSPVGDNLSGFQVTPVSWSFDANTPSGWLYLNSNSPFAGQPGNSASFVFSTDATGMLTAWSITVDGGIFVGTNSSWADASITSWGDSFSSGLSTPLCGADSGIPAPCYDVSESNSAGGSWTSKVAAAPEFDPASSMSALTLLLGGLLILRGRRSPAREYARK